MWIEMDKEIAEAAVKALRKAGEIAAAERFEHYFALEEDPRTIRFRLLAERKAKDGELEFDEACVVSFSDENEGAYVMAWTWIVDDDLDDWKHEVAEGNTVLGFEEWLKHRKEAQTNAPEPPPYTRNAHPSVGGEDE